jgi:hypothetical protein
MGDSWQVSNATGAAAGTAFPTTTAGLQLWNGEPAGGKSYVIDSVGAAEIVVDATQSDQTGLFVCNNKPPVATPTDAALVIRSLSGRTSYGGRARTMLVATAMTNDGWFLCGTSAPSMVTAVAGAIWKQVDVRLDGLYIVPPGGQFNVQAVKVAGAAAQMVYTIRWHEMLLIVRS